MLCWVIRVIRGIRVRFPEQQLILTQDLNVNLNIQFSSMRMFFSVFVLHCLRLSNSNQKFKHYKLTNVSKGRQTEIETLTVFLFSGRDGKIAHHIILFPASNFVPIHKNESKDEALWE